MRIARFTDSTSDAKTIVQFKPDGFDISGHLGYVRIDMPDDNNRNHTYRIALKKEEAIELLKQLYEYLEDEL